ncbi:hypothetical protein WJ970_11555 [Achromobacter xylosoxidans]
MKRLLGMLSLQRKFLLLGGLSLILFAVPLLLYVKASWETAAQKRLEAAGARPVATLLQAVRLVQAHRGLSNLHLNGGREAGEERRRLAPGVDAQWRELDTRLREAARPPRRLPRSMRWPRNGARCASRWMTRISPRQRASSAIPRWSRGCCCSRTRCWMISSSVSMRTWARPR